MGWTVLYIAFGIVALWLLGEVLLQYKARLRWRLLAFAGFLCVVLGVLMPSVLVIGLGTAAFAVGQTYVTLSFRRGFAAGWAVSRPGPDGEGAKRRRGRAERKNKEAGPETAGVETAVADGGFDAADTVRGTDATGHADGPDTAGGLPGGDAHVPAYGHDDDLDRDDVFTPVRPVEPAAAGATTAVYEPLPLPDDTGSYGVYGTQEHYAAAQGADQGYGYDYSGYGQQGYGYDGSTGQPGHAGYADPYGGDQTTYGGASYDTPYATQDPYATGGYGGETPAGGVWVPQQRGDGSPGGGLPPEQPPYPYQGNGQGQTQHGAGFDEQYRF
ncbi:hypothetical protein ACF061_01570 [Streptomyces sp. NPDC015220]|uniref:SCO2102 family sporulation regulator n=1 Tax=Streptomyces sp. NPDC015220 TaxID=3364947 RepID=UPI0037006478